MMNKKQKETITPSLQAELDSKLFNLSPDPIAIIQDQMIVHGSPSLLTTFGYTPEELEEGLPFKALLNKKELLRAKSRYQSVVSNQKIGETFKINAQKKDGTELQLEARSRKIDYKGKPAVLAIIRDVTTRINTESALLESEEHFRVIAEQSPNMIFIDLDGKTVFVNEQSSILLGVKPSDCYQTGFDMLTYVAPSYRKKVPNAIDQLLAGKDVPPFEQDFLHKSGEIINAIVSAKLISYQSKPAILGIVTDITAHKRTEKKLATATRNLSSQKRELENKNAALKEILTQIENEKLQVRKQLSKNINQLLKPILHHMKKNVPQSQLRYINILDETLTELTSDFGINTSDLSSLSPRQLEICSMIRNGMPNKEIADMLGVSVRTVEVHRNNIRKKLGLSGKNINLYSFLANRDKLTTYE